MVQLFFLQYGRDKGLCRWASIRHQGKRPWEIFQRLRSIPWCSHQEWLWLCCKYLYTAVNTKNNTLHYSIWSHDNVHSISRLTLFATSDSAHFYDCCASSSAETSYNTFQFCGLVLIYHFKCYKSFEKYFFFYIYDENYLYLIFQSFLHRDGYAQLCKLKKYCS